MATNKFTTENSNIHNNYKSLITGFLNYIYLNNTLQTYTMFINYLIMINCIFYNFIFGLLYLKLLIYIIIH